MIELGPDSVGLLMSTLAKVLLFPALGLRTFMFFLFFLGGGATGRQADAIRGLLLGGSGLVACIYCGYRIYFGPGLVRWDWIALLIALSPIVLLANAIAKSGHPQSAASEPGNRS